MEFLKAYFYTLTGIKEVIDLGDFCYGEWIVYENNIPLYHINLHTELLSDKLINSLLNKKIESIESIIHKINVNQGTKLSLNGPPLIRILKKEETVDLDLIPLPEDWIKNLN